MILRTRFGDREFRDFGPNTAVPSMRGVLSYTGRVVTPDLAAGLPAVASAVLHISELVASLPMIVYRGRGGARRRAEASWQWRLLHDAPNQEQSAFDFFQDVSASVESAGNAFVQKIRNGSRVVELHVLSPDHVRCYRDRDTRTKRFDVYVDGVRIEGLTDDEILHIRGATISGGHLGHSPIALHRHTFGNAVAMEEFAGRFFRNNARPGVALKFPSGVTAEQAKEYADVWDATHAGPENAHRTGVIGGGADIATLPVSLEDSQFVEGMRYGVAEIARIFRIPKSMLEEGEIGETAQEIERFAKLSLLPRLRRIERALAADPDLFGTSDPYPEFLADALLRPDTVTRYRAYKDARQGSWVTANEIRELENLPPVPGGDEIQVTPVGGAPNPRAAAIDSEFAELLREE